MSMESHRRMILTTETEELERNLSQRHFVPATNHLSSGMDIHIVLRLKSRRKEQAEMTHIGKNEKCKENSVRKTSRKNHLEHTGVYLAKRYVKSRVRYRLLSLLQT
jgi:hypothetical protein